MRMCDADNLGLQLTESIWCLLCKNPMHNEHGCDGACDVDKTLANKINDEIVNIIKANTVDAIEVVRCKDCIYSRPDDGKLIEGARYCSITLSGTLNEFMAVWDVDYCSNGKRCRKST